MSAFRPKADVIQTWSELLFIGSSGHSGDSPMAWRIAFEVDQSPIFWRSRARTPSGATCRPSASAIGT